MQTRWTKGLDDKEVEELKLKLVAATNVLERLTLLIEDDLEATIKNQEAKTNYDNPSWVYCQADAIGETRAYKKILRLINLKGTK